MVRGLKERPRLEPAVRVIAPANSVEVVPASLDGYIDGRAARKPLLRVEGVGNNVHLLDGLGWRNVNCVRRQPWVNNTRAINPRVVLQSRYAIDVERHGPLRVTSGGVILGAAAVDEKASCAPGGSWNQKNQTLVVSADTPEQGQVVDLPGRLRDVHVAPVGL